MKIKKKAAKFLQSVAKKAVENTVGKSAVPCVHELPVSKNILEKVKKCI